MTFWTNILDEVLDEQPGPVTGVTAPAGICYGRNGSVRGLKVVQMGESAANRPRLVARAHEHELEPVGHFMGPRPFGKLRQARRIFPKGPSPCSHGSTDPFFALPCFWWVASRLVGGLLPFAYCGWLRVWCVVRSSLCLVGDSAPGDCFALPFVWWLAARLVGGLPLVSGGWIRVWWAVCRSSGPCLSFACPLLVMAKAMNNSGIGKRGSNDQLQPHHKSASTAVTKTTVIGSSG